MPRNTRIALTALLLSAVPVLAQQPTAEPLEVGAAAPDFTLPGATRYASPSSSGR